jgi:hypothetical protein
MHRSDKKRSPKAKAETIRRKQMRQVKQRQQLAGV